MKKYNNTSNFIEKANNIHNNKYDYSKVEYKGCDTKVCIICPEHGEFWQTPYVHNNLKCGCPKCGHIKSNISKTSSKEEFIEKAKGIHGDKYDYSKVDYVNSTIKVCIVCPIHGEFWQTPDSHLRGRGCMKCSLETKSKKFSFGKDCFIRKANEIHKGKYDYSKVEYVNAKTKVCIICPEHGEFWQTPYLHNNMKCGCPKCGKLIATLGETNSVEEFKENARKIHGDKYDYSKVEYVNAKKKVEIICPTHGSFYQTPDSHIRGCGCQRCSISKSSGEEEIYNFLAEIYSGKIETRNRTLIKPYELDIFLPDEKIGIEYNGLRWHSDKFKKDKFYHLHKLDICNAHNIKLISIFEDEWKYRREIVKNKIKHILHLDNNLQRIYARKCIVKIIDKKVSNEFLEKNHIQGKTNSTIAYGSFYGNILVGVMSFKKNDSDNRWELVRFATDNNFVCCGVGGKLFKKFLEDIQPKEVKSFADRRWTVDIENNLYTKIGFQLDKILKPDYKYVFNNKRIHKFNFRKKILHRKYGFDLSMTEKEMTEKINAHRIYDCGLLKYVWKK